MWRCGGYRCRKGRKSIRAHSYFAAEVPAPAANGNMHIVPASTLPLTTHVQALYQFSLGATSIVARDAMHNLMSTVAISKWFNAYRELMSSDLLVHPVRLGGVGRTVQIDESYFSGKRKYHRGRLVQGVPDPWILGLLDCRTKQVAMFIVENRSGQTLVPLIARTCRPRSTLVTDGWGGYSTLRAHDNRYSHIVVNHEENFVDPTTGAHTNEIEGFWAHAKAKYKQVRGFPETVRPNYIDEIQWRWNNRLNVCFVKMLEIMAEIHNPTAHIPADVLATKPDIDWQQL